ncbi:MAG: alpha amylase C-terminal domain-containing protein [Bacteroidales bacterium]|nr:alpha amylase C-terminal domain-containing protein [Bacteroidales bacterium]MBR1576945.1 alpha amylase C-terminal domain-containing protein [Bacteroidales bacterium]
MKTKMIYEADPYLRPFADAIDARHRRILETRDRFAVGGSLSAGINNHLYYGLHREADGSWVFREWAPHAARIYLIGECNNWCRTAGYALQPVGGGTWELRLPPLFLHHGQLYKLFIEWPGGGAERLPSYATRCVQDPETKLFCAQVWDPAQPYVWKHGRAGKRPHPLIYECHIGMSSEEEKVASFEDFRRDVLPKVADLGYNVLQIMALQEHPYYGSFGYQVSNFFALSSRFGTPEEFKALVDDAHGKGIAVVMDIVHSHAVSNEAEGLGLFDGREDLYFYEGPQGHHPAWGSRCFNYGKDETKHFLLSNCKFWMEEYRLDGFRFDGVTSMLYWDHGLGKDFGDYALYFNEGVDENAVTYLALANLLVHEIDPNALTVAEDVSGMAGLAAPLKRGGIGFDFRMSMGVADHWIKWIKERRDEDWSPGEIWWELTNKREDEKTISYAECHDQALVGDKTLIFRLMDKEMYFSMDKKSSNLVVDRGIALHKMIRLVTAATSGDGYLNFMGNEFGHPEWIDFPREGNGWSYAHARRQWSLAEPDYLRYKYLRAFDKAMVHYLKRRGILSDRPVLLVADEEKKILIFSRNNSIFAFNFHPAGSFADYGFSAPAGTYRLVLSTDEARFDGFDRLRVGETHISVPVKSPNGNPSFEDTLYLYLPGRCAMVYEKLK